jgi:hypothetical protein
VLGHAPDSQALAFWVQMLKLTDGRAKVAGGIERSDEARARVVSGWYAAYLGRTPGAQDGVTFFVDQLRQGATEETILAQILASAEYLAKSPDVAGTQEAASSATFVKAIYAHLLGRQPGAPEVQYFAGQAGAAGRAAVASQILASSERRNRLVTSYYADILGRPSPAPAEVAAFANSGLDQLALRIAFEASTEYFALATKP